MASGHLLNRAIMSSTLLPFLYQTRTLWLASRVPLPLNFPRFAHSSHRPRRPKRDNAIPFEWGPNDERNDDYGQVSTITPSEAQIFKGIFDEIAQGKMPTSRKRPSTSRGDIQNLTNPSSPGSQTGGTSSEIHSNNMARSIVEQARVTEFREKFLMRYPRSLRNAAQVALGLYEFEPESSESGKREMIELDEADEEKWAERARYDRARADELERVEGLMKSCETDQALWKVMEDEVFSLPKTLGILETQKKTGLHQHTSKGKKETSKRKEKKEASKKLKASTTDSSALKQKSVEEEKRIMDVHGPLYSQFINTALSLFDTAFAHPSPYTFQILPRIKELGLPSYVLGVSTPFYSKLARVYWNRFGDANSALDVLQEMNSVGLYADEDVKDLLATIRDHLHGCTWGAQGPFVMAMMESPPYDSALTQRLEDMEKAVKQSLGARGMDYAS